MKLLNTTNRVFKLLVVAMLVMTAAGLQAESSKSDGTEVVITLQNGLIQAMQQGQKIGYSGRLKLLTPIIQQTHDLAAIIRSVLGAHWAKLNSDQQQAISQAFQENSIATYADRFSQYDGEQFKIVERTQLPRGRILVRSQLIRTDGNPVNFDYVMNKTSGGWRIINIVVDGVSDLALKRAEYNAVLQKNGIAALIDMLEQKTAYIEQSHQ
ncbi:ABC transporter substrate-binding protein [Nitrosomonas eutropha]|uniref:Phospholipid transport system substrate-binding protein n=2 Tax=Nitrosomonas eutropha TaxID=916 RepID=A0ABX5M948_9PROT|nr:ABC transporter substrate-binding protein [Nitrosomonas eutropha]PXV83591.1 phospholipid transport system substrate-binding protein [Nitrosomonas eutropha]SEI58898.1 phospholipid transport system substrate-binding protein [Nitrosomonas eutropha]